MFALSRACNQIVQLPIFVIPIIIGLMTQATKVVLDYRTSRSFSLANLRNAWWFPSVHSSMSASILTVVRYSVWIYSVQFAIAMTFAWLLRYDAINVRYEAGIHAKYINEIRLELRDLLSINTNIRHLKERLGHTLSEVIGGIVFGIVWTMILLTILGPFISYP